LIKRLNTVIIVDSESGDFGTLKNVGYEDDFILVDTKSGLKRLRLDNVYDIMSI